MPSSDRCSFPDRYLLLEQVGQGGSGTVYKALDRRTNQLVAVKFQSAGASPGERQLWDRLTGLMVSLDHPGLVQLLDWGEDEGHPYLVFEWVEGKTLARALQHSPRFSLRLAVFVACSVLRSLEVLHERGIIHRDVKPSNIFLFPEPGRTDSIQVKLGDLGVAHTDEEPGTDAPGEHPLAGTPAYMPPEQWNQGGQIGPASDLYSLGCTLYEMICGQRPFAGGSVVEMLMHHLTAPRPDPRVLRPEVPEALAALILRLLAIAGEDRPVSAQAVREALETIPLPEPSPGEELSESADDLLVFSTPSPTGALAGSSHTEHPAADREPACKEPEGQERADAERDTRLSSPSLQAMSDSWLLDTSAVQSFCPDLVVLSYPAPIALAYRRYCGAAAPGQRLELLFQTVEASLRYLVLLGLADLLQCLTETDSPLGLPDHAAFDFLRRPRPKSPGLWLEALRETARALADQPGRMIGELPEVCRPGGRFDQDLLGSLLAQRQEVPRPTGPGALSAEDAQHVLRQARPLFVEFLSALRFLASYPLGFVTAGPSRDKPGYRLHSCMGAAIAGATEAVPVETSALLEEDIPLLSVPGGRRVLYLWPLLLQRLSPLDTRHTLYLFEDLPDRKLPYLACARYTVLTLREEWRPIWRDRPASDHQWFRDRLRQLSERSAMPAELSLSQRFLPWRGALAGLRLGRLQLLGAVGRGGFATVYAARASEGPVVAVKVLEAALTPDRLERFRAEFDRLAGIWRELEWMTDPPGIIRCFETGSVVQDGRSYPWYSMEFALGGDLNTRIRDRRQFSPAQVPWNAAESRGQVIDEFRQIASAAAFLHRRHIVHRDLKPSNVLILDEGRLGLSDLGLAGDLSAETGLVVGTRFYRAPEQEQAQPATLAADVYSLGIFLAELALGARPEPTPSVSHGSTLERWRRLQQLPWPLRRFLLRLTDVNPANRPPDSEALLHEFVGLVP